MRRTRVFIAVAAVVVLASAVAALAFDGKPHRPGVATDTFDLYVRTISAEPVDDYSPNWYRTSKNHQRILWESEENSDAQGSVVVWVAGAGPAASGEPMPPVNGRPALWTGEKVAWEWAPGCWAFAEIRGPENPREVAHEMAETVRFDANFRWTFPYTVQTAWPLNGVTGAADGSYPSLEFENGVHLTSAGGAYGNAPKPELEELERSVRPVDPPVRDPLR